MSEYYTNVVVEPHNAWTLTKHVAGSINKAAAKIDQKVYGTKATVMISPKPAPPVEESHGFFESVGMVVCGVFALVVIIAVICGLANGNIKWYHLAP